MDITIAVKELAALAMSDSCPRCFWIKHNVKKIPFQIFPGIFSTIDSYSKKYTRKHYELTEKLPQVIEDFFPGAEPIKVPHYSKFTGKIGGLTVRGTPDEILKNPNGEICILDYKTSKITKNQDKLRPLYDAQLKLYGFLATENELGKVEKLGLCYYEPVKEIPDLNEVILEDGFKFIFRSKIFEIESFVDLSLLANQACRILSNPIPRLNITCTTCAELDNLLNTITK